MGASLLIGPLFEIVKMALGGLGLDPEAKARAQAQALEVLTQGDFAQRADMQLALAQLGVNKAEAESAGLFKGGWRPFIGWICGVACAWNWLGLPVATFVLVTLGHPVNVHPADLSEMWPVLIGMLGLGAFRTTEKIKGAA